MWILWSYVGLWAATVTEILVRFLRVSGWVAAASGSVLVVATGWYLIERFDRVASALPTRREPGGGSR